MAKCFNFAAKADNRIEVYQLSRISDGAGGFDAPVVVLDLTANVNAGGERGLLGLELDPDFSSNRFFYLLYSTDTDQRIVRYRINTNFDGVDSNLTGDLGWIMGPPRGCSISCSVSSAFTCGSSTTSACVCPGRWNSFPLQRPNRWPGDCPDRSVGTDVLR